MNGCTICVSGDDSIDDFLLSAVVGGVNGLDVRDDVLNFIISLKKDFRDINTSDFGDLVQILFVHIFFDFSLSLSYQVGDRCESSLFLCSSVFSTSCNVIILHIIEAGFELSNDVREKLSFL